ncbi:MAG: hypothetical protein AMS17_03305 [Spirochaetes bacterium DG_61]|nr:MAG: hypothetical protein AMS17_03305 [Spirochaetes bacterium DG_61]
MITEIPAQEYGERVRNIQKILSEKGIDILITFGSDSEPQNIIYLANYWPAFESACVIVPVEGEPILVIGPESETFAMDYSTIRKIRRVLEHRESSEPNYPGAKLDTYETIFHEALNGRIPNKIAFSGFTITTLPVYEAIKKAAGKGEIVRADNILNDLRMKKSKNEIALMKRSAEITMMSFEAVKDNIKPGMEEVEVVSFVAGEMFKNKAENLAYTPYILSGKRTNQAIGRASHKVIRKDEPVQFSCGCRFGNYSSSIGRPFCIGKMPEDYRRLVQIGVEVQKVVLGTLKAGISAASVFKKYWEYLEKKDATKYFLYGPCHGTGIMENEHPFLEANSDYMLFDGMAYQVDVYLGDENFGIRFEDGVVVREGGVDEFTSRYREIIEL